MTRRRLGFTVSELVMAMAILGIFLTMSMKLTAGLLGDHRRIEVRQDATDVMRRTHEVISQELRSAVRGTLIPQPYPPGATSLSLLQPTTVAELEVVESLTFETATNLSYYATAPLVSGGQRVLLANNGRLRLLTATATTTASSEAQTITHQGCANILSDTGTTVSPVIPVGYRYDAAAQTLYESRDGIETPLAWQISDFGVTYIYEGAGAAVAQTYRGPRDSAGRQLTQVQVRIAYTDRTTYTMTQAIQLTTPNTTPVTEVTAC